MDSKIKELEERVTKLENIIKQLQVEQSKIKYNEFVGMEIKDFYCNGFFGRDFDLNGAMIIENTDKLLTIRKTNGEILQTDFEGWDMRKLVMEWVADKPDE